ncbi:MAG: hypothetical protein Q4C54_09075 [Clostridia bacterium]|nr:hypothetical protein [Clostridia bacterium]
MTFSKELQEQLDRLKLTLPEGDECTEDIALQDEQDAQVQTTRDGKTLSNGVVSIMAYLIGVPEENFGKTYKRSVFDELERKDCAKTIRALCAIRNAILLKPGSIVTALRGGVCNLDSIPECIDPAYFQYLSGQKIRIVTGSQIKQLCEYVITINNHIGNKVNDCLKLFPAWVNREYIRSLLMMPKGGKRESVQSAMDTMKDNANAYPFHCYINWPINRSDAFVEDPENYLEPVMTGNVMLNDRRFMILLYRINGAEFTDFDRVFDASTATKDSLTDFMAAHDGITLLVDCENSDPYKLCALFDFIRESRRQREAEGSAEDRLGDISRIILFDDYHTVDAWDVLVDFVRVPVHHEEVERVLGHKSLVDIAMTAGACKDYYQNGTRAFMIASSDSDYWGLMRALPDAAFMVLAEKTKFSQEACRFYDDQGVATCLIDDFAGNLTKIKEAALRRCVEKHINNLITVNLFDTLEDTCDTLRLDMSLQEKENFRRQILRSLRVDVDDSGELSVKIEE